MLLCWNFETDTIESNSPDGTLNSIEGNKRTSRAPHEPNGISKQLPTEISTYVS